MNRKDILLGYVHILGDEIINFNNSEEAKTNSPEMDAALDSTYAELGNLRKEINKSKNNSSAPNKYHNMFYIYDNFDRPYEKLVMIKEGDQLSYINHNLKTEYGSLPISDSSTPLEDFGFEIKEENGVYYFSLKNESRAKYENGEKREWQGAKEFTIKNIWDKNKIKLKYSRPFCIDVDSCLMDKCLEEKRDVYPILPDFYPHHYSLEKYPKYKSLIRKAKRG